MSDMNGGSPMPPIVMTNPVIELLTHMLADAKAGKISSVAVVAVTPQAAIATAYAGGQRGDMFVGFSLVQKRMLQEIEGPPVKSPILRPAMLG